MYLLCLLAIIFLGMSICVGLMMYWIKNTEIEMYSVTHLELQVSATDFFDYRTMLYPPEGKAHVLNAIKKDIRIQISTYMKNNNLKLKKGVYYIPKKSVYNGKEIEYPYDDYMDEFDFEKIY